MKLIADTLACERGGRRVFSDLTFALERGQGLQLTGPNGAGKSSLLRLIAGFLRPAAGRLELEGGADDVSLGEQCHFVGHLNGIKRALSVAENAAFWADYLGGGDIEAGLERLALGDLRDIPAGLLSAGQARRLGLVRLAIAERPLWLLDEPSVSLDAASQEILAGLMREHLDRGGLVMAATHVPLGIDFTDVLTLGGDAA